MEDWNDLRLVLAVARTGSLKGAAQILGVNHSTAFRRTGRTRGGSRGSAVRTLLSDRVSPESKALDLTGWPWLWDETAKGIQTADWLAERVPETAIAFRTNSVLNQFVAARADIGLALLPCYLSDSERELERITPEPMPELTGELWIVTRADLRRTACERAFFDIVGEGVVSQRELLGGERIVS